MKKWKEQQSFNFKHEGRVEYSYWIEADRSGILKAEELTNVAALTFPDLLPLGSG